MSGIFENKISQWLRMVPLGEPGLYRTTFDKQHLGNIFIRSLHGGLSGASIEISAETITKENLTGDYELTISSVSIDYLRITRDTDLYCKANIVRMSKRLSVVDVVCWQDTESTPVVRGTVTLKITRPE